MDYEQKYKDLVKAVKELQEANPSDEGIQNWVNENVSELVESEDERVRKESEIKGNDENITSIPSWSEQDEEMLESITKEIKANQQESEDFIGNYESDFYNGMIDWLKSLKNRIVPQPKEWSEEDKRIISAISQLLKDCESENSWNCVYSNDREVFFTDIEKWLKSLKQRETWKPSNEQMNTLLFISSVLKDEQVIVNLEELKTLYNDLKKL